MITVDYSSILNKQYQGIKKGEWKMKFFSSTWVNYIINSFFSLDDLGKKLNQKLEPEIITVKGLLAHLRENQEILKGKDLRQEIQLVNDLIKKIISYNTRIETVVLRDKKNKYPQIRISATILSELLDYLYSCLRILKKANQKQNIDTSEIAVSAASISAQTLEKVLYCK